MTGPLLRRRPIVLCVLDGVGERAEFVNNGVRAAQMPALAALRRDYPTTLLRASGPSVGLSEGAPGSSEAGYRTLGAGRAVESVSLRIDRAIADRTLGRNDAVEQLMRLAKYDGAALHLFALLSESRAHASLDHLTAMLEIASFHELDVVVHAVLDGRDGPRRSAFSLLDKLSLALDSRATLGTLSGRRYAMDGDGHWDRVYRAYHAIVRDPVLGPTAPRAESAYEALEQTYASGLSDDELVPVRIGNYEGLRGSFVCDFSAPEPAWGWTSEAAGFALNTHPGGLRQLTQMLTRQRIPDEIATDLLSDRGRPVLAFREHCFATLTTYDPWLEHVPAAFSDPPSDGSLLLTLARAGRSHHAFGETERRFDLDAFFANGADERIVNNGRQTLVPSPRLVESHLERPSMSAPAVAREACASVTSDGMDFLLVSLANADVLAGLGDRETTIRALEAVDAALGELVNAAKSAGATLLVTASHGNAEQLTDDRDRPSGAATANPVPFILVDDDRIGTRLAVEGSLADVAPTILALSGVETPAAMTGRSLLERS